MQVNEKYDSPINTINVNNYLKPYVIEKNNDTLTFLLNENNTFYIYKCQKINETLLRTFGISKINRALEEIYSSSFFVFPMVYLTTYTYSDDIKVYVFVEIDEHNTYNKFIEHHYSVVSIEKI